MNKCNRWIIKFFGVFAIILFVWTTYYFGYTYVKLVTQPKDTHSTSPSTSERERFLLTLDKIEFWTCQMGVFNSEKNANKEKERLQQLGWDAQVISKDPFVVAIGFAYAKDELLGIQELLKEGGMVTVPKLMINPERAFQIRGTGAKKTAEILKGVNTYLNTPYATRESILPQFENLMLTTSHGLTNLHEASLSMIKAERTLPVDMRKIMSLRLYGEYLSAIEVLKS
ncbi:SPOR domain-containing protein [Desulfitobacterium sp. THU1]|uniref:SPOR domain-containing protein n=1 Tax=Desulfitobacterium sp. THU1 TaxID=3138072 RepID=UPI00311EA42A